MEGEIEALVRDLVCDHRCSLGSTPVWLEVVPEDVDLPPHGWKLHVSARATRFADVVRKLVPLLLDARCLFKLARSQQVLFELNDGTSSPATVGKAFTVYPAPEQVRDLGWKLVELLRGETGPRILSDRRIAGFAPVYYRYGPFVKSWQLGRDGTLGMFLRGPNGEEFDGEAGLEYHEPGWAADPFAGERRVEEPDTDLVLGDRYRVLSGLYESVRGNVYRALDEETGNTVVVKQARALVAESTDRSDTRMRIRNERRVLQAAGDIVGVPRFVDHFSHVDDEFIVTTDQGSLDLRFDLEENGPYPLGGSGAAGRSLGCLARELARILAQIHRRGIIMRDLSSKNVVVDFERTSPVSVIDFGISSYDGVHLFGGTRGYMPERQWRQQPPLEHDDIYALGMVLIEAATGLPPIQTGDYADTRTRALQSLWLRSGDDPDELIVDIADLVDDDPEVARAAFHRIRGDERRSGRVARPRPVVPPEISASLLTRVTGHLLSEVLDATDALLSSSHSAVAVDPSLFAGTAGIGAELLHHDADPRVRDRLTALVERTLELTEGVELDPGLLLGRTGVEIFLWRARGYAGDRERVFPSPEWTPREYDLVNGAAGVGIGHLWLYRETGDPRDLAIVRQCADALPKFEISDGPLAHGLAGVVEFQLAALDGAVPAFDRSDVVKSAAELAHLTERMLARAESMRGTALETVSWCNGLAGMARVLLNAGKVLGRPDFDKLALTAAGACAAWAPRVAAVVQCCGLAGIGDLMVDLSTREDLASYRTKANEVARHLLLRAAGPPQKPQFTEKSRLDLESAGWASGPVGILAMFRRLRDGGGDRLLPGL